MPINTDLMKWIVVNLYCIFEFELDLLSTTLFANFHDFLNYINKRSSSTQELYRVTYHYFCASIACNQ